MSIRLGTWIVLILLVSFVLFCLQSGWHEASLRVRLYSDKQHAREIVQNLWANPDRAMDIPVAHCVRAEAVVGKLTEATKADPSPREVWLIREKNFLLVYAGTEGEALALNDRLKSMPAPADWNLRCYDPTNGTFASDRIFHILEIPLPVGPWRWFLPGDHVETAEMPDSAH